MLRFQIAIPIYIRSFFSTLLLQRKFKVSFPELTLETTFRIWIVLAIWKRNFNSLNKVTILETKQQFWKQHFEIHLD